ncbi:MAG: Tad domain-containing protein [Paracoccaceae bacterium]
MTNDKRDSSLLSRLRNSCTGFTREERGSATLQVIFFSLMVFGMTGVVLDSGRVYDTHNGMQMFADRVALLAANELDRKSDSIDRAKMAVFGDGAGGLLAASDLNAGEYVVDALLFYDDMEASSLPQNDMSEAFPDANFVGLANADGTTASDVDSEDAAYVVAVVRADVGAATRFMTQTIVNLGFNSDVNRNVPDKATQIGPDSYALSTVAAATLDRVSCADLSSLVMCNPWEDQDAADNPLLEPKELPTGGANPDHTVPGRSLFYFAPNFANNGVPSDQIVSNGETHGSLFPWNVNHQLFQIADPIADPSGVCSGEVLRNLAGDRIVSGPETQEYMQARDRCLMAQANAQEMCWSDDDPLKIKPADGDTVLRAVNTASDLWLPPLEDVLPDDRTVGASGPAGTPGAVSYTPAVFFEPDRLALITYENADRFSEPVPGAPAQCDVEVERDTNGDPILVDGETVPILDADGLTILQDARLLQDGIPDYNKPWPCDDRNTPLDESDPVNATIDIFQPAYDTIPGPGMTYVAGTRGEGMGYDFCHDKTLGRQDFARQDLTQCLNDAAALIDPTDQATAEVACQEQYELATTFEGCSASATPGREREECGCEIDFVGDHHAGGTPLYMFARTKAYRNNSYDFKGDDPNIVLPISPFGGPNSWHTFYQAQREVQVTKHTLDGTNDWLSTNGDRSRVVLWNGEDPPPTGGVADYVDRFSVTRQTMPPPSPAVDYSGDPYLKHWPDSYLDLTGNTGASSDLDAVGSVETLGGALIHGSRERRRILAAMVNCGVVTGEMPDDEGNLRSANDDGSYDVTLDDMYVMDSYIPNPAGMFCGEGDVTCEIADSVETSMYIELIEDVTDDVTSDNFTARLVR